MSLDSISILFIWTAISVYVASFISFTVSLAVRSEAVINRQGHQQLAQGKRAPVASAGSDRKDDANYDGHSSSGSAQVFARIGVSLTVVGALFHLSAALLRGLAVGRVPWANLYEFAMLGTLLIVLVYLLVLTRIDLRFIGSFVIGIVAVMLGLAASNFYVEVSPLAEPLKSVWLVIHVFVASLASALFTLSFSLSVVQLLQSRRERLSTAGERILKMSFLKSLPPSGRLENLSYRFIAIGFIFWSFTLIAGSIWAYSAWSRYWGFDVKETWTFVIWVLYAGYIHARATRGWRGDRSAWLSILSFSAVIFNFAVVNVFFKGLHSYSGLA